VAGEPAGPVVGEPVRLLALAAEPPPAAGVLKPLAVLEAAPPPLLVLLLLVPEPPPQPANARLNTSGRTPPVQATVRIE
jgi:hypothetical protein